MFAVVLMLLYKFNKNYSLCEITKRHLNIVIIAELFKEVFKDKTIICHRQNIGSCTSELVHIELVSSILYLTFLNYEINII